MGDEDDRIGRRAFLGTTAAAAAGLALGCGDGTTTDGGLAPDAGGAGDAGATDAGADAGADAGTDAGAPEPIAPPEDTPEVDAWGLGVASGDVTTDAAILWTRYDGAAPLTAVVWELDAAGGYAVQHPRSPRRQRRAASSTSRRRGSRRGASPVRVLRDGWRRARRAAPSGASARRSPRTRCRR
ncbi:MAG: hypothetical protein H6719_36750 [Sandaracinaceae bacterium]|nr:hypothetical protein [Sandaracinaceae bacterium]